MNPFPDFFSPLTHVRFLSFSLSLVFVVLLFETESHSLAQFDNLPPSPSQVLDLQALDNTSGFRQCWEPNLGLPVCLTSTLPLY